MLLNTCWGGGGGGAEKSTITAYILRIATGGSHLSTHHHPKLHVFSGLRSTDISTIPPRDGFQQTFRVNESRTFYLSQRIRTTGSPICTTSRAIECSVEDDHGFKSATLFPLDVANALDLDVANALDQQDTMPSILRHHYAFPRALYAATYGVWEHEKTLLICDIGLNWQTGSPHTSN